MEQYYQKMHEQQSEKLNKLQSDYNALTVKYNDSLIMQSELNDELGKRSDLISELRNQISEMSKLSRARRPSFKNVSPKCVSQKTIDHTYKKERESMSNLHPGSSTKDECGRQEQCKETSITKVKNGTKDKGHKKIREFIRE